jgi:hypothetical protein
VLNNALNDDDGIFARNMNSSVEDQQYSLAYRGKVGYYPAVADKL